MARNKVEISRKVGGYVASVTLVRTVERHRDVTKVDDVSLHLESTYRNTSTAELLEEAAEVFVVAAEEARRLARSDVPRGISS